MGWFHYLETGYMHNENHPSIWKVTPKIGHFWLTVFCPINFFAKITKNWNFLPLLKIILFLHYCQVSFQAIFCIEQIWDGSGVTLTKLAYHYFGLDFSGD